MEIYFLIWWETHWITNVYAVTNVKDFLQTSERRLSNKTHKEFLFYVLYFRFSLEKMEAGSNQKRVNINSHSSEPMSFISNSTLGNFLCVCVYASATVDFYQALQSKEAKIVCHLPIRHSDEDEEIRPAERYRYRLRKNKSNK